MVMTGHNNDLHALTYFGVDDYYWTVFFSILLLFYAGMDKQPINKQKITLKAMDGSSESAQTMQVQKFPEILASWKQLIQLGSCCQTQTETASDSIYCLSIYQIMSF